MLERYSAALGETQFFAFISRLRWVKRWGLKHNLYQENVLEHSAEVAMIAHGLAVIHNDVLTSKPPVNADRIAVQALYHDSTEAITSDCPTPVKNHDPEFYKMYKAAEQRAEVMLVDMLPDELKPSYEPLILSSQLSNLHYRLIKAADVICAYAKCDKEVNMGNREFIGALKEVEHHLKDYEDLPAFNYFMEHCYPGYQKTLDSQMEMSV
jgi:5'-deoxynucleotidase